MRSLGGGNFSTRRTACTTDTHLLKRVNTQQKQRESRFYDLHVNWWHSCTDIYFSFINYEYDHTELLELHQHENYELSND